MLPEGYEISVAGQEDFEALVPQLRDVLHRCVEAGASVNFVLPFSQDDALAFWRRRVEPKVKDGLLDLIVAFNGAGVVGTVMLDRDTPPNQPHRADVSKLLVHPDHRRKGLGNALMARLEERALEAGRTLLTLDTRTGDSAEPLYKGLGYQVVGSIPDYSVDPFGEGHDATTLFYKQL
ncbi:MAG: GNAT family N-acetyltransferase [Pseudomonadota bacterium]